VVFYCPCRYAWRRLMPAGGKRVFRACCQNLKNTPSIHAGFKGASLKSAETLGYSGDGPESPAGARPDPLPRSPRGGVRQGGTGFFCDLRFSGAENRFLRQVAGKRKTCPGIHAGFQGGPPEVHRNTGLQRDEPEKSGWRGFQPPPANARVVRGSAGAVIQNQNSGVKMQQEAGSALHAVSRLQ
jgi:hypothetical protein